MCLEDIDGVEFGKLLRLRVVDEEGVGASRCKKCGTAFPLTEFSAYYQGHFEDADALWHTLTLVEPYLCLGCMRPTTVVHSYCRELEAQNWEEFFGIAS